MFGLADTASFLLQSRHLTKYAESSAIFHGAHVKMDTHSIGL